jgi:hypothetical protein
MREVSTRCHSQRMGDGRFGDLPFPLRVGIKAHTVCEDDFRAVGQPMWASVICQVACEGGTTATVSVDDLHICVVLLDSQLIQHILRLLKIAFTQRLVYRLLIVVCYGVGESVEDYLHPVWRPVACPRARARL